MLQYMKVSYNCLVDHFKTFDLSRNRIKELTGFSQPRLLKAVFNENLINTCSLFTGHKNLVTLELKKNRLTHCEGIANLLQLKELYLNENFITDFSAI